MKTTALLLLVLTLSATAFCSTTLMVPGEISTIQEAIDASLPGDVIVIAPGTYAVNLVISTDIELRSEIADSPPILESASWDQAIIKVDGECDALLENLNVQGSYGIAVHVIEDAQLEILNCTFSENEMDLHISDSSTAKISRCSFSHFYQYSIRLEDEANLNVSNCRFEIPVTLNAISAQGKGDLEVIDTIFIAFVPNLYEEFVGGIEVHGPTSLVARDCNLVGLGMGIHGGDYRYFSVRDCTFEDGLFGIHGLGRTSEPWELAEIVDCTFRRMGQPIKLYGQVGLIDISDNLIQDTTEGPTIGLCLEMCGGCPLDLPPFIGEITGSGNTVDDGNRRTCPPYRAPFWPENFLK